MMRQPIQAWARSARNLDRRELIHTIPAWLWPSYHSCMCSLLVSAHFFCACSDSETTNGQGGHGGTAIPRVCTPFVPESGEVCTDPCPVEVAFEENGVVIGRYCTRACSSTEECSDGAVCTSEMLVPGEQTNCSYVCAEGCPPGFSCIAGRMICTVG
jgi:hypothetical protein